MISISGDRSRLRRSYLLEIQKQGSIKVILLLLTYYYSRVVYPELELVAHLSTQKFIKSIKRLIARRGCPKIVYSGNVKTFQAGAKWLTRINKDENFHNFLRNESITWNFKSIQSIMVR